MRFFKKGYYTKSDLSFLKKEKRFFAFKHHPDKGGKEKDFKEMMEEFETIEKTIKTDGSFGSIKIENISNEDASNVTNTKPSESYKWYDTEKKEFIDYLIDDFVPIDFQIKFGWLFSYTSYRIIIFIIFFLGMRLYPHSSLWSEILIHFAFIFAFLTGRFWAYAALWLFIGIIFKDMIYPVATGIGVILSQATVFWFWALPVLGFIRFSVFWETSDEKLDYENLGERIKQRL